MTLSSKAQVNMEMQTVCHVFFYLNIVKLLQIQWYLYCGTDSGTTNDS